MWSGGFAEPQDVVPKTLKNEGISSGSAKPDRGSDVDHSGKINGAKEHVDRKI